VCEKALEANPDARYQTAAEMRRDIMAATRALDFDEIPEETLGAQMVFLFRDRVLEKGEMLRRVGAGSQITNVPGAEVDISVSLPGVDGDRKRVDPMTPFSTTTPVHAETGWSYGWTIAVAAAILLGVGVGLGVAFGGGRSLVGDDVGAVSAPPAPATAAVEPDPDPAAPTNEGPTNTVEAPTEVTLHVSSTPVGATVTVDGEDRGVTPLDLTLLPGDTPLSVRVGHDGFAPTTQRFVPSADGRIDAVLEAVTEVPRVTREPRARPPSMASMASPMRPVESPLGMDGSPFRRFD
jgi:hypothetical protein